MDIRSRTLREYLASLPNGPSEQLVGTDLRNTATANFEQAGEWALVAQTGDYNDLNNLPALGGAAFVEPSVFATAAQGLLASTALQPGSGIGWDDVTGKPTFFSGAYADLTGKPTLFSGVYDDLTGKPDLFSGAYSDLTGLPDLFSGFYSDLSGKPVLGALAAQDLIGVDDIESTAGTPSATTYLRGDGAWATPSGGGGGGGTVNTIVPGVGIAVESLDAANPVVSLDAGSQTSLGKADTAVQPGSLATVATSGAYNDLSGKPTLGTAAAANTGEFAPASHVSSGGTAHANVVASGAAGFMSGTDKAKLDGIDSGATANTGTVTSVGISTPTGLSVTGSPVSTSGTFAVTWDTGYQAYTAVEAAKLSGIASGATANQTDSYLLSRANHTGTQAAATVTGLASVATSGAYGDLSGTPTIPAETPDASTTVAGKIELMTAAEMRSRTPNRAVTPDQVGAAKGSVSLAYSATRSLVWTDGWYRTCTLSGNMTISNPTSVEVGDTIMLRLVGSNSTERSISWGTYYKGNLPDVTLTSTRALLITLTATTTTEIVVSYVVIE